MSCHSSLKFTCVSHSSFGTIVSESFLFLSVKWSNLLSISPDFAIFGLLGHFPELVFMASFFEASVDDLPPISENTREAPVDEEGTGQEPADQPQDDEPVEQSAEETATEDVGAAPTGFSIQAELAHIPLSATAEAASTLQVVVGDVDLAADQARADVKQF